MMPVDDLFQSLSGFQVRCNPVEDDLLLLGILGFNPYRVFKFVATEKIEKYVQRRIQVSIPIGFSSSLQPQLRNEYEATPYGFNPYRVFKFVATPDDPVAQEAHGSVSIPIGFSSSLQPVYSGIVVYDRVVSIPIGFSSSLQPLIPTDHKISDNRFNPYRVFKFVATSPALEKPGVFDVFQSLSGFQVRCNPSADMSTTRLVTSFNPYRVFKFVATLNLEILIIAFKIVSIPIGFSSSLQHLD